MNSHFICFQPHGGGKETMRLFLIVLDSVGAGYLPDAGLFGDVGANTLGTLASSPELSIPNLVKMGIGNIEGLSSLGTAASPEAAVGRCIERSMGKDTIIGHWEIAGLVSPKPLPTYPNGFPEEIIDAFSAKTGRGVIVNKPYSGTEVIRDYGTEHVKTGKWIVYTSADSVFQIAAHEDVIPLDELYRGCEIARDILTGDNAVGRVIARPFVGTDGDYRRTTNRRDFSLEPFAPTLLDALKDNGKTVIAVGKIHDIFAGRGISESIHTDGNTDGMNKTLDIASRDFDGLCFVNLVDFDMLYGHRRDIPGYARALSEFDAFLPSLISKLGDDDVLIITADHGCDPGYSGTDHTREYIPLIVYGKGTSPQMLGTRSTYADIAATAATAFGVPLDTPGTDFFEKIKR